jgi:hypothetical protein
MSRRDWRDGYEAGQLDALDWLARGPRADDEPLAAICESAQPLASMWCLARNLAIGAALCKAFDLGRDLQHVLTNADFLETHREVIAARAEAHRDYFHPGCGRSAP